MSPETRRAPLEAGAKALDALRRTQPLRGYEAIARALQGCSFLPGSWDNRFARDLAFKAAHTPEQDYSERQRVHLLRLANKYRRQLPTEIITLAQDLAEIAAEARVAEGKGALADFTPARDIRRAARKAAAQPKPAAMPAQVTFNFGEAS